MKFTTDPEKFEELKHLRYVGKLFKTFSVNFGWIDGVRTVFKCGMVDVEDNNNGFQICCSATLEWAQEASDLKRFALDSADVYCRGCNYNMFYEKNKV